MNGRGLSDLWFLPAVVTRAPVPHDVESVQTIDHDAEIDPRAVGLDPDSVEDIWAATIRWYQTGIHPAISLCMRVRGQIVLKRAIGYSHGGGPEDSPAAPKVLATPDTPFNAYSASKPMVAMVIHLLDQRHQLHLDDPVCEYIPDFARHGKESVTIRHVLTHRAGIPTLPEEAMDLSLLEDVTNRNAVALLCDARPTSRAGGRLAYHAITGGFLLGEIVRRVTGKNIRTVIDDEFRKPLGWRWMNYGVKRRDIDKVARNYFTGFPLVPPLRSILHGVLGVDFEHAIEASNDPRFLMGVLPAANLFGTADEISQFYQLLLNGGELRGVRVFEPRTVWRATAEQSYGELDFTLGVPLRYGMGFMLGGDWLSLYGLDTRHAFGHLGFTNVVTWADPQRHLAAAVMTSGKPALYPELYQAFTLTHAITQACPKDEAVAPARSERETGRPRAGTPAKKAARPRPGAAKAATAKVARAKAGAAKPAAARKPRAKAVRVRAGKPKKRGSKA
ncbi:MAG: beta-lactamase family protein [Deltaproteobacteria bacterium]|nr:beta-lactamase family protein [Deltaproteobacteria bacterium]